MVGVGGCWAGLLAGREGLPLLAVGVVKEMSCGSEDAASGEGVGAAAAAVGCEVEGIVEAGLAVGVVYGRGGSLGEVCGGIGFGGWGGCDQVLPLQTTFVPI